MTRVGIAFSILFVISVIAFNNCSSNGFNLANNVGSINLASSQCRSKIIDSAKPELFNNPSLCETAANYQCDLRHFRPGVGHEQKQQNHCTPIAGFGDACVSVVTYNFDTSTQQRQAEASDLVEGGSYNRDEASCINTRIIHQNIPLIQAEGSSVDEALEKSIELCRQRSRS